MTNTETLAAAAANVLARRDYASKEQLRTAYCAWINAIPAQSSDADRNVIRAMHNLESAWTQGLPTLQQLKHLVVACQRSIVASVSC